MGSFQTALRETIKARPFQKYAKTFFFARKRLAFTVSGVQFANGLFTFFIFPKPKGH
jgi:hypothetical protein